MKTFRIVVDATFEAKDIDNAMVRLALHFLRVLDETDETPSIFDTGGVTIGRADDATLWKGKT